MNFFHALSTPTDQHPLLPQQSQPGLNNAALAGQQASAPPPGSASARDDYELAFQARTAAAMRAEQWIRPLLSDLRRAVYPDQRYFGFIYWINQDDSCPWIVLSQQLEYSPRDHTGPEINGPDHWDSRGHSPLHWALGRFTSSNTNSRERTFQAQLDVELAFEGNQASHLIVSLPQDGVSVRCDLRLVDLTKTLARLHPLP